MIIYVGSLNKVKVETVKEVFALYESLQQAEVRGVKVNSKIPAQPTTLEETMWGARNRAHSALQKEGLSIGLESGIFEAPGWEREKTYMDHTVCVVYDGKQDYIGFSPAFRLPRAMLPLIFKEGMDLNQASQKLELTTKEELGNAEGLVGILTKGVMDRKAYMKPAVIMALASWENRDLY